MCLTEQELTYDGIVMSVCEGGSWGCFCGYHGNELDREQTMVERMEVDRRVELARMEGRLR